MGEWLQVLPAGAHLGSRAGPMGQPGLLEGAETAEQTWALHGVTSG